jgi:hypothetical protein
MDERDIEESIDERDRRVYRMGRDAIEDILSDPPPPLVGDITFEETLVGLRSTTPTASHPSTRTWSISPPTGWRISSV